MKKRIWLSVMLAFMMVLGSVGLARAEILPPRGEGQIGLQAVVLCETLTVRREPSASSKAVETLKYGDLPIVMEQADGWAYCALGDSEDALLGWVNADYIAIDPAWYRTEGKTPVYAWNDVSAPKLALLDGNAMLPILKREGEWLVVSLRGAAGWIHAEGESTEPAAGRRDGERFEDTIVLEGMEETAHYEHIVNEAMGIEMDYDYELFERRSEADRERFVSIYDDPGDPVNWFEVSRSAEDVEATVAAIGGALSDEYDIRVMQDTLARAGDCTVINADCVKGGSEMAEFPQTVYVIPAGEGCVVATAHMEIESREGFGARIRYMMETLAVAGGAE